MPARQLPRGVRNNNPGNLERTAERWIGMSPDQSSDPRFMVFDTPEHGIRALMRLLINYQERHGLKTVREVINRWAPPVGRDQDGKSYTQNTSGYVHHVSRQTGFDPDEPLDILDRTTCEKLARAIVRHENGNPSLHGRPDDWYDDATYSRALVMAGFAADTRPLVSSRTVKGVAVTAAAVAAEATGVFQPEDVATAVTAARAFGLNEFAEALPHVAAILGLAYTLYARWDDARRKLR